MFRWLVRVAPVCGDHAQQATGTGDQWRRLNGADANLAISFEVLRARHEIAQFDVRHDRSIAGSQRNAASASRGWPHPFPKRRSCLVESPGVEALYEKILDAAVAIMRSDFASM